MQNNERKQIRLNWQKIIPAGELGSPEHAEFLNKNGGVYLWIFDGTPNRVCNIGEAGCFSDRFGQHKKLFEVAGYTVCNLEKDQDWLKFVAEHLHEKTIQEINDGGKIRIPTAERPTATDSNDEHKKNSLAFFSKLKFAFATIEPNSENTVEGRDMIEAALIYGMRDLYKAESGCRLITRGGQERLVGHISRKPSVSFSFEHIGEAAKLLPPDFLKVVRYPVTTGKED